MTEIAIYGDLLPERKPRSSIVPALEDSANFRRKIY